MRIVCTAVLLAACGPSTTQPPRPPPPPPPATDAATGLPADIEVTDPLPPPPPPAPDRAWLAPTKVSWPPDRVKAQFIGLGGGVDTTVALAISGDGSTPAGYAILTHGAEEPVRWRNGVMEPLKMPDATVSTLGRATALSFDGRVVAGIARDSTGPGTPLLWREGDPPRVLPLLAGSNRVDVRGLSRDGTIAVGCGGVECTTPVRWTGDHPAAIEGPQPFTVGTHPVTTDGKIVVGTTGDQAARLDGRSAILKDPDSGASAISDDGKLIVGHKGKAAVMWRGTKATQLGALPGHVSCSARAISADGGRIVGNCLRADGGSTAWVWDAKNGMRSVADALAAAKISTVGWSLEEVHDICSYGVTLVGSGPSPGAGTEAWMAILPRW